MLYVYRFLWPLRLGWLLVCCVYEEVYLQSLNVFPFDYMAVAGSEKVWPVNQVNHTSWVAVVTPTDRPKSVRNRCVIELFVALFVLSLCSFDISGTVWAFVIGLSQISSFVSCNIWKIHKLNFRTISQKTTERSLENWIWYQYKFSLVRLLFNAVSASKRKRKRSNSVLWQKPLHQQKCQKGKVTTQTTPQKSSITQQLRTDLGRSVGVTTATQLVWLTGLRAHLPTNRNSRLIKRTHV